jgi:hypothetical protein
VTGLAGRRYSTPKEIRRKTHKTASDSQRALFFEVEPTVDSTTANTAADGGMVGSVFRKSGAPKSPSSDEEPSSDMTGLHSERRGSEEDVATLVLVQSIRKRSTIHKNSTHPAES